MKFCKDCKYSQFIGTPEHVNSPESYFCQHESSLHPPDLVTGHRRPTTCQIAREEALCGPQAHNFQPKELSQAQIDGEALTEQIIAINDAATHKVLYLTCILCGDKSTIFPGMPISQNGQWTLKDGHWQHQCPPKSSKKPCPHKNRRYYLTRCEDCGMEI